MTCVPSEDSDLTKDPSFLHADSEDSDKTGRMPRLISVFAGRTGYFVGFVVLQLIFGKLCPVIPQTIRQ